MITKSVIKYSFHTSLSSNQTKSKVIVSRVYCVAEAYYCTENGKVKGVLTVTEHLLMFDPIRCSENDSFVFL